MRKRSLIGRAFGAAVWLVLLIAALAFLVRWRGAQRRPYADNNGAGPPQM
jgi:hypothetical protein